MNRISSRGLVSRAYIAGLTLVAVLGALTGCVSAPSSDDREASLRGTEICIINKTAMNMSIQWRGYPDARPIAPEQRNCNSGYEKGGFDVEGVLTYTLTNSPDTPLQMGVRGNNPFITQPFTELWYDDEAGKPFGESNIADVGDIKSFQGNGLRVTIKRLEDSDRNKEFEVTLSVPSGPNFARLLEGPHYIAPA